MPEGRSFPSSRLLRETDYVSRAPGEPVAQPLHHDDVATPPGAAIVISDWLAFATWLALECTCSCTRQTGIPCA